MSTRRLPFNLGAAAEQTKVHTSIQGSPTQGFIARICYAYEKIPHPSPTRQMSTDAIRGRRILVVGWDIHSLRELIEGLKGFAGPGTRIVLVCDEEPPNDQLPEIQPDDRISIEVIVTDINMSRQNFELGGLHLADTVIIGVPSSLAYPDNDALVLSALLQLEQLAAELQREIHVIAKAHHSNTKRVVKKFWKSLKTTWCTFEIVIPTQVTSAVLTNVLEYPQIMDLIQELMVLGDGNELYILDLGALGFHEGEEVAFGEMVEAGRLLQMTCIGYLRQLRPVLSLCSTDLVKLEQGDRLVVVGDLGAED